MPKGRKRRDDDEELDEIEDDIDQDEDVDDDRPRKKRRGSKPPKKGGSMLPLLIIGGASLALLLVVGVVVMFLMNARASSASRESMNNLKQCALGVHTFHDNFNKLPPAYAPGGMQTKNTSMWFHLLPFVEQAAAYTSGNADGIVVSPYLSLDDGSIADSRGTLSYAGNIRIFGNRTMGNCNDPNRSLDVKPPETQVVSGLKLQGIADGTTNVIMLATRNSSCGAPSSTRIHGDPNATSGAYFGGTAITSPPAASQPGEPTMMFQLLPSRDNCISRPSGVAHNFNGNKLLIALCDSSIRTISSTMTPKTFGHAMCPGDGNPLGADWGDE